MKQAGKAIAAFVGRRAVRTIRALGSPLANTLAGRRRAAAGLALPIDRPALVRRIGARTVLEIGPFFTPLLRGSNVAYFDVLDTEALRARAKRVGGDPAGVPDVTFVSPVGDLSVVDRQFMTVISAHVVEHQPDLVRHLADVARLLQTGGDYWLIVPDRRYSFDHPFPESTYDAVVAAHNAGRMIHSANDILMHLTATAHNNALLHWLGWHGAGRRGANYLTVAHDEVRRAETGEYVDVHAWIFTPASFKVILTALHLNGLSPFRVAEVTDTAFGKLEFFARLTLET